MSRARRAVVSIVFLAAASAILHTHLTPALAATDEVRGLWVQRTSLASPAMIAAMVAAARDGGFNTLLVQVRGRGEAFYDSEIEPRSTDLDAEPASFDPLATTLELAHTAGLRVHAWINVNLVASAAALPRSHAHVVFRHPEWLMVPSALASALHDVDPQSPEYVAALARWTRTMSTQVEGLYLSPISDEAQSYTIRVVSEIATKYAIDGIHLDYLRYPTEAFDYSRGAIAAFRALHAAALPAAERQRLDARSMTEPMLWTSFLPEGWAAYRRDRLTALATRLAGAVRRVRPRAMVTIAVSPSADEALSRRLQNWRAWAAAGDFDAICPMAYAVDPKEFADQLSEARAAAGATPLWVGVGAYQLPVATTADRLRLARRAGATGVLLFSYEALAPAPGPSAYFAALRPVLLEPPAGSSR
jgi:uncharacterized lipoprotein YddW (UPF0748 family)